MSVLPTPRSPLPAMPPDRITRYDITPIAIAPLMSDSGAGSAIDSPSVVITCRPSSSNIVLTKMYTPTPKMYAPRKPLRCGLFDFARLSNVSTSVSSSIWNFPGTILKRGTANTRISAAATSSSPVTVYAEISPGLTVMPSTATLFRSCSTASRMASRMDSSSPPGLPVRQMPAISAAAIRTVATSTAVLLLLSKVHPSFCRRAAQAVRPRTKTDYNALAHRIQAQLPHST